MHLYVVHEICHFDGTEVRFQMKHDFYSYWIDMVPIKASKFDDSRSFDIENEVFASFLACGNTFCR